MLTRIENKAKVLEPGVPLWVVGPECRCCRADPADWPVEVSEVDGIEDAVHRVLVSEPLGLGGRRHDAMLRLNAACLRWRRLIGQWGVSGWGGCWRQRWIFGL